MSSLCRTSPLVLLWVHWRTDVCSAVSPTYPSRESWIASASPCEGIISDQLVSKVVPTRLEVHAQREKVLTEASGTKRSTCNRRRPIQSRKINRKTKNRVQEKWERTNTPSPQVELKLQCQEERYIRDEFVHSTHLKIYWPGWKERNHNKKRMEALVRGHRKLNANYTNKYEHTDEMSSSTRHNWKLTERVSL